MVERIARGIRRRIHDAVRSPAAPATRQGAAARAQLDPIAVLGAFRVVIVTLVRAAAQRILRSCRDPRLPRPLRVGVDIRPFYEPLTGVGFYLREILDHISRDPGVELVLFGDAARTEDGPRLHVDLPPGLSVRCFDLSGRGGAGRTLASIAFPAWIWLEGCDVHFAANYFLPRAQSAVALRRVITVHDLTFRRFPALLQDETLESLERAMPREIAHADAVICVSEATRCDLVQDYDVDPARIVTIHSGMPRVGTEVRPVAGLPARFVLFVSTIEPRKNLAVLLDAFESLRDNRRWSGDLVIVGKVGWKSEPIVRRITASRWSHAIHHLDYLSRDELAAVYRRAEIFVLPSHYEGFGFTLLEAMAHGIPSIAARTSSLPEVGGDAVLYFDPDDADDLAETIATLAGNEPLKRALAGAGPKRAEQFRWHETAEKTLAVLRRAGVRV